LITLIFNARRLAMGDTKEGLVCEW
jgi:hypothetical protein